MLSPKTVSIASVTVYASLAIFAFGLVLTLRASAYSKFFAFLIKTNFSFGIFFAVMCIVQIVSIFITMQWMYPLFITFISAAFVFALISGLSLSFGIPTYIYGSEVEWTIMNDKEKYMFEERFNCCGFSDGWAIASSDIYHVCTDDIASKKTDCYSILKKNSSPIIVPFAVGYIAISIVIPFIVYAYFLLTEEKIDPKDTSDEIDADLIDVI